MMVKKINFEMVYTNFDWFKLFELCLIIKYVTIYIIIDHEYHYLLLILDR